MIWSQNYKIGIPTIDAQHKRLFEIIGELQTALQEGLKSSDFERILQNLDQYKTRHFQLEEKYMVESGYPGLAKQQEAHQYFMKRFQVLGEELAETGMTHSVVKAVQKELTEWLEDHVTGLDMEFGKYYQKHTHI